MDIPIELCTSAKAYKKAPEKRVLLTALIIVLYAVALPYCYLTAGEPRQTAMVHAQKLADERWAQESSSWSYNDTSSNNTDSLIPATVTITSEEPTSFTSTVRTDEFADNLEAVDYTSEEKKASFFSGFLGPSKEQKRAQKEFDQWRKEFQEKSGETVSLPPEYLPSAWACLALFGTVTLHLLFYLLCHWLVSFKAMTLFNPAKKLDEACYILVVPPPNRGSAAMVAVAKSKITGNFQIEFQRQKYVYTPASRLGDSSKKYPNGVLTLYNYPVDLSLSQYLDSRGIVNDTELSKIEETWGKNHLAVAIPSFIELLKLQLLTPLSMFQVFTALLWLLDEYWSYTLFTLASVVVFEATTVFQRSRTQKMLGGMAPRPTPLYVFRGGKWTLVSTKDVLPGDLISLAYRKSNVKKKPAADVIAGKTEDPPKITTHNSDIIPCDCLLLKGSAVVNEASLTGESVPQMKEAVSYDSKSDASSSSNDIKLDMNGINRVNTLFSGCSFVTVSGKGDSSIKSTIPSPPDHGAIAYVLRTGFGSSQGKLLQMIEFSQQSVTGNAKETGLALLVLFIFALFASGYVLKVGLEKKEKTTHELLLKCVIIITSVVPRQFPMQMAMAVNMALMALTKAGVFCTEPYRVPLAGKVSHCLFDKTGTLTTDQLVPVGIVNADIAAKPRDVNAIPELTEVKTAEGETALILAACHSLVVIEDDDDEQEESKSTENGQPNLVGDPIELSAIRGIEWSWDGKTSTAKPDGTFKRQTAALAVVTSKKAEILAKPQSERTPIQNSQMEALEKEEKSLRSKITLSNEKVANSRFTAVEVLHRHHFSSKLKRMSVVVKCHEKSSSQSKESYYCLVKGSPEAIQSLLQQNSTPIWFTACYEQLARRGLRVLALAYKRVEKVENDSLQSRSWAESELFFGGFIAFECKVRADSEVVVRSLQQSDHRVIMVTGDALLTSLHIAKQVGICNKKKPSISLTVDEVNDKIVWTVQHDEYKENKDELLFDAKKIAEMAKRYNLLTTEDNFLFATDRTGGKDSPLWKFCGDVAVFARMSPQGKAKIIQSIQENDKDAHICMCGDGGNDVGALKQADIGLALLSGHANANTTEDILPDSEKQAVVEASSSAGKEVSAEDFLNAHNDKVKKRLEEVNKLRQANMKEFQARYTQEQQVILQEEMRVLSERGEWMQTFTLMKNHAAKIKQALNQENARFMAMHGQAWDPKKDGDDSTGLGSIEKLMDMDGGDMSSGGLPMVRPGDASIAAPFTSRIPSVRAVVDLIRQGRCTLLSALMQQQIMMLESIIAAYTLSALSLHNARSSERQMMASSWLIMTAAVSFSYASPLDHMHPLRPLRSLFHPAIFISILGQAAIHIACMTLAVQWATEAMGPEKLQEVTEFFKKAKAKEIDTASLCGEDDYACQLQAFWTAPFLPNLLNSVTFLVETSQMISVFFTNYKGRPWMKGMLENHPLFLSVFACVGGVVLAAWEFFPQLNELIQLTPFPDDLFRYKVVGLVLASIAGTFIWDRLCVMIFAPKIFSATVEELKKTTLADFVPILFTVLKVVGVLFILGTGNILLAGLAFWWYRSYTNKDNSKK